MTSTRDIPSSSSGAAPIATPFHMSQYVEMALISVVPSIQYHTDRVSDFLWYPNTEHRILEAATGTGCSYGTPQPDVEHLRAYILEMITCKLLADLPNAGRYNWRAATLACLYRGLNQACLKKNKTFIGPCILLQHWSWAHLIVGRPTITCKTDVPDWGKSEPDTCPAYTHRYCYPKTYVGAGHGGTLGINH